MFKHFSPILIPLILCHCAPSDKKVKEESIYLDMVRQVDLSLTQISIRDGDMLYYPDAHDTPEKVSLSYSDGMSHKVIFYLDLFSATEDSVYYDKAVSIGNYLLSKLPKKTDPIKGKFWAFSPYGNVCGPGFALSVLYKHTQSEYYREAALNIVDVVEHFADNRQDTISWDLGNDVLGGLAGTGLYLLQMSSDLNSSKALDMSVKVGNTLIERAIKEDGRWSWKRGQDSKYILPNFSHGPAGIAYFFVKLYEATSQQRFLDAALRAVAYLDTIAKRDNGGYLLPYGLPDPGWDRPYDIGWAHGPAGVARLFMKLHQITTDAKWLDRMEACYIGVLNFRPLLQPHPDFGDEKFGLSQRFGLAGVATFFQQLYRYTGEDKYLLKAKEATDYILLQANQVNGLSWPIERFSFMENAGEETVFTGYFYGSTGFGTVLLNQHRLMTDNAMGIPFVDVPLR